MRAEKQQRKNLLRGRLSRPCQLWLPGHCLRKFSSMTAHSTQITELSKPNKVEPSDLISSLLCSLVFTCSDEVVAVETPACLGSLFVFRQ